jgi:hypothetical protein
MAGGGIMNDPQAAPEVYYCPTVDEIEMRPGGGFDVCCDAPEKHRPVDLAALPALRRQWAEPLERLIYGWAQSNQKAGNSDAAEALFDAALAVREYGETK